MGSSCSSVKRKDRQKSRRSSSVDSGPHVDLCGQRRCSERSIESLPYGAKSSPPSTSKSSQQPEVSVASRSNGDSKVQLTEGNQVTLDSSTTRNDKFLAVSATSPIPASPSVSPFVSPLQTKQSSPTPDLSLLTSDVRSLLLGQKPDKFSSLPTSKQFFIMVCCNQKDPNFNRIESIFSHLQHLCSSKGFELHLIDFHLSEDCIPIGDNSYDDLCLQILRDFNDSNENILNLFVEQAVECLVSLPSKIEETDFSTFLESDSKHLLSKWYALDSNSLSPQFIIQRIKKHFPGLFSENVQISKETANHWKRECSELRLVFDSCISDQLKKKYLLPLQQKQIDYILKSASALKKSFLVRFESENSESNDRLHYVSNLDEHLPELQKVYVSTSSDKLDDGITSLIGCLKKVLENMIDKSQEESQLIYSGIESSLYRELIQQERIRSELAENFFSYELLLKRFVSYINSSSNSPLVLYGLRGCGKSAFIAKFSRFSCLNFPSFAVIHRSVGLSEESLTREQLFRSIYEQFCALYGEEPSSVYSNLKEMLAAVVKKVPTNRSLLILIDGIDHLAPFPEFDAVCIPREIPGNVKIIFTATTGSTLLTQLNSMFGDDNMVEMPLLSVEESFGVFTQIMNNKQRKISNAQTDEVAISFQNCHSPVYAHLLANEAVHWRSDDLINESVIPKDASCVLNDVLIQTGQVMGVSVTRFLFSLLCVSKHGFTDSQLIYLLSWEKALQDSLFTDNKFPYVYWFWIKVRYNYLFHSKLLGGKVVNSLKCLFKQLLSELIPNEFMKLSRERISNFFNECIDIRSAVEPMLKRSAVEELPYAAIQIRESDVASNYIFNMEWLTYKVRVSDSFHVLEDIDLYEKVYGKEDEDTKLLKDVIVISAFALRYDGSQIFSQLYARLNELMIQPMNQNKYPKMKVLFDACCKPSLTSLMPLNTHFMSLRYDELSSPLGSVRADTDETFCFISVIKGKPSHIVSLSSNSGKIVVWNVYQEKAVRTLTGISQPRNLKMVDEHRALVLCNRELKVYNLDSGVLESKLKGVMNQNMPFYGLHDEKYVVALSRNRMYVNMMNVVTGDLETQFKVGEDRFLNSLLVSANGKICVCGDETQKPFPLLVWDLSSRKLVYDLRIPHHEFVTRLAAISDDGHYVVSVCKELNSMAPNFIIVYDLQSGTLFKKWKPECNTSSIAISSQGGFVLNGIENCHILVWDLSTGAKRHNLIGHSAPVDTLQIDETGKSFLSLDSLAKDRSIRIWNAESGTCLAVFTPDYPLSCCQLSSDGKLVVFCFKRCSMLHTLLLFHQSSPESERITDAEEYGQVEFNEQLFDLSAS